jgi:hypothetical protein
MSWVITGSQPFPAVIGEAFGGGYFAGYISHTADGNPTHALIVAPRATGATGSGYTLTTMQAWKTANTTTAGTGSTFDGVANTAAMVTAGIANHPAANFCTSLSIGGFTDWYLPSQLELDIAYFNLKPTTALNATTGIANNYAVPLRASAFTAGYPAQTPLSLFASGGAEAFVSSIHWSSTEVNSTRGFNVNFTNFQQDNGGGSTKTSTGEGRVRAFRRIAL